MPEVNLLTTCHTCSAESRVQHEAKRLSCFVCHAKQQQHAKERAQAQSKLNTQKARHATLKKLPAWELTPVPNVTV